MANPIRPQCLPNLVSHKVLQNPVFEAIDSHPLSFVPDVLFGDQTTAG